jgi:acetyl esterase/lipase
MSKAPKAVPLVAPEVFLRIRPEATEGGHAQTGQAAAAKKLHAYDDKSVTVGWTCKGEGDEGKALAAGAGQQHKYMKRVLPPEISQDDCYEAMLVPLVDKLLGFSGPAAAVPDTPPVDALFFAYGQTGSGKTFTTVGPDYALDAAPGGGMVDPRWGCFPRVVYNVFDRMKKSGRPFTVAFSAVEFYLFAANDLLNMNTPVVISNADSLPQGLKSVVLRAPEDIVPALTQARNARHVRTTLMNTAKSGKAGGAAHSGSSRGHACFILTVLQMDEASKVCRTHFNMVDMAGAERPDKTGEQRVNKDEANMELCKAYVAQQKGEKAVQLSTGAQCYFINFELFCLIGTILTATDFNKKNKGAGPPCKPKVMVDTDAMKVMGACFAGTAAVSMVVTLSQAPQCGWETWFSCKYGADVANLRTPLRGKPFVDAKKAVAASVKEIKEQVAALKAPSKNMQINWRRSATAAWHKGHLVLLRALLAQRPPAGVDVDSVEAFDLAPPMTTGFAFEASQLQKRHELLGKWNAAALEQFASEDVVAGKDDVEEFAKMPIKPLRAWLDNVMDAQAVSDPVNKQWLAKCAPTSLNIDTTPFAPCDNKDVLVTVHSAPAAAARPTAALVYAHGGGGIAGKPEHYAAHCARYAVENGVTVFNVKYRLAPENKAPAGIFDVVGVVLHVHANAAALGVDPSRIAVAGDSGGGLMAAGAARELVRRGEQDKLKLCIPVCPQVSDILSRDPAKLPCGRVEGGEFAHLSWREIERKLTPEKPGKAFDAAWVWPSKMSKAVAEQFPKTAIVTGEFDFCRRMAEDLGAKLAKAGRLAEFVVHPGVNHCWFLGMSHPMSDVYWADFSALLKAHL